MVQEPQEAGQAPLGGDRHLGGVQGEEGLDLSEVDLRLDLREHPVRSGFSGTPGEKDAKKFSYQFSSQLTTIDILRYRAGVCREFVKLFEEMCQVVP